MQWPWPPSFPVRCPSPVCPPTVRSTCSISHPSISPLRSGQITEPGITADYPAHRITNPTPGGRTQRAGLGFWKCRTHAFQDEPGGIGCNHTPGKCHRKGIYFMGYTRQDNQPLFRTATGPPHCERTATTSPLNLLMHCTKWIPPGLSGSH